MKRYLQLIILALLPMCAWAEGQWTLHQVYLDNEFQNIADLGDKVYYLDNGALYQFDKQSHDIVKLDKNNLLTDQTITHMYFNAEKDFILLVYDNSNMDFLYSDGTIRNYSAINDAIISWSKVVNDVTFVDNLAYVATNYGYLVLDVDRMQAIEEHMFEKAFASVAPVGDVRVAVFDDGLYVDTSDYHDHLNSFKPLEIAAAGGVITPLDDTKFVLTTQAQNAASGGKIKTTSTLSTITLSAPDENGIITASQGTVITKTGTVFVNGLRGFRIQASPTGLLANFPEAKSHYNISADGATYTAITGNDAEIFACNPNGDGTMWAVGINGVHVKGNSSYYRVEGTLGFAGVLPYHMSWNWAQNKLYLSTTPTLGTQDISQPKPEIYTFDGTGWTNATPYGLTSGKAYGITFLKNDSNSYFLPTGAGFTRKIMNDTLLYTFSAANSPLTNRRSCQVFDSQGNLWMYQCRSQDGKQLIATTADQALLRTPPSMDSWTSFNIPEGFVAGFKKAVMTIGKDDVIAFSGCWYGTKVIFFHNDGTLEQPAGRYHAYNSFVDQNGKLLKFDQIHCVSTDPQGRIWIGTPDGVVIAEDPLGAVGDRYVFTRPVVKASGEYLVSGMTVNDIAFDSEGRAWIATNANGLWLANADGTEVINNWMPGNSNIPSAVVYQVCVAGNTGSTFVTTSNGVAQLVEHAASSGYANYDNVLAYPNPVLPDFTGLVTISGLMDGSTLRIVDRDGAVVAELTSRGGTATWDCCDAQGNRVPTGTYRVLATTTGDLDNAAEVTRIGVLR